MIRVRLVIEGAGNPEEYLRKVLEDVKSSIEKICKVESYRIDTWKEENFFVGNLDVIVIPNNLFDLFKVVFEYSPILVEVLKFDDYKLNIKELEDILSYLSIKLNDMVHYNRLVSAQFMNYSKLLNFLLNLKKF